MQSSKLRQAHAEQWNCPIYSNFRKGNLLLYIKKVNPQVSFNNIKSSLTENG
jgi:hypothetical protein